MTYLDEQHFRQTDLNSFIEKGENFIFFIESKKSYVKDFVYNRLGGRSETKETISGKALIEEIQNLIDKFSQEIEKVPTTYYTIKELQEKFNVSHKTILNWKKRGLVSYKTSDNNKLIFSEENINRFCKKFPKLVERGKKFERITGYEINNILNSSERLDKAGCNFPQKVKSLAFSFNRSQVSIRDILKKAGHQNLEKQPRTPDIKTKPIVYVYSKEFEDRVWVPELSEFEGDLLSREEEIIVFKAYNYLKFKAFKAQERGDYKKCQEYYDKAMEFRNEIIVKNYKLIYSVSSRQRQKNDFISMQELVDKGLMSLMLAIDKFDFTLGNKFSTLATDYIFKLNLTAKEEKHKDMNFIVFGPVRETATEYQETDLLETQDAIIGSMRGLDEYQKEIIFRSFGLLGYPEQNTEEIAKIIGKSKPWVMKHRAIALGRIKSSLSVRGFEFEDLILREVK